MKILLLVGYIVIYSINRMSLLAFLFPDNYLYRSIYSLRIINSGTEIINTGASSMYLNQM